MFDANERACNSLRNRCVATHDSNGNTQTKVVGSNTTSYAWDFENRMSSVTLPAGGGTITFKYDPFGRRIYKSSSSGTSIYAYDGNNLVEETNAAGGVVARYVHDRRIDEPLAMLRGGATSYYQADGLGSVTSLSNAAGTLAQTYTLDSFGNQTASSGSLTNAFRYTGREFDIETSLYYYRARYYDPYAGRFVSEDPIGFKSDVNFYRYVRNRPLNFKDPSGKNNDCATQALKACAYTGGTLLAAALIAEEVCIEACALAGPGFPACAAACIAAASIVETVAVATCLVAASATYAYCKLHQWCSAK
jgi:RHS repeat-associated protein